MAEIEQQGHTSRSLQAKVLELQQGLARRAHAAEEEALEMRQRQLASLRAEHAHALCEVREI